MSRNYFRDRFSTLASSLSPDRDVDTVARSDAHRVRDGESGSGVLRIKSISQQ